VSGAPQQTAETAARRAVLRHELHERFAPGAYDNWVVWAGNLSVDIDGLRFPAQLARAYVGPRRPSAQARVRAEVFVANVAAAQVRPGDVEARVWTDANERDGSGRYYPMTLQCGPDGASQPAGNNLVFESAPILLERTGAFSYTVELSAGASREGAPERLWVPVNDLADNRDGVIVVSPDWIQERPSVMEICARKTGAEVVDGAFRSGRLRWIAEHLQDLPAQVVYLLPFFRPGLGDSFTGADVRKGTLGSVYAVSDFYQIDPDLLTPLEEVDLGELCRRDLLREADVADVFARLSETGQPVVNGPEGASAAEGPAVAANQQPTLDELVAHGAVAAGQRWGRDRLVQLVGRAELRDLTRRAHQLGKRVIFDLVLMQTSRDSHLIDAHPDFYLRDEDGRPRIHQIAWLVYSDVALFDLVFNDPLQDYLLEVAPYWMAACDLDGVRIDASQTVDRPFLKRIKNRVDAVKDDALVLGETLCPLDEALDIPVDMVYALFVDFHRDADRAEPLVRFLEEMHGRFAAGTVAMAYFENHDSPRATQVWRQRYAESLAADPRAAAYWTGLEHGSTARAGGKADAAVLMALLKNLQASLIDLSAGMAPAPSGQAMEPGAAPEPAAGTQLAYGLEWGSEWGEETRTDFENEALLHLEQRDRQPRASLVRAYGELQRQCAAWMELGTGRVYYHRNDGPGGDADDAVLAYARYDEDGALLVAHNLDHGRARTVTLELEYLEGTGRAAPCLYDSYRALGLAAPAGAEIGATALEAGRLRISLLPLQSLLLRLA